MGLDSFKTDQIHYKIDINPHNTTMEILSYSFSRLPNQISMVNGIQTHLIRYWQNEGWIQKDNLKVKQGIHIMYSSIRAKMYILFVLVMLKN